MPNLSWFFDRQPFSAVEPWGSNWIIPASWKKEGSVEPQFVKKQKIHVGCPSLLQYVCVFYIVFLWHIYIYILYINKTLTTVTATGYINQFFQWFPHSVHPPVLLQSSPHLCQVTFCHNVMPHPCFVLDKNHLRSSEYSYNHNKTNNNSQLFLLTQPAKCQSQ